MASLSSPGVRRTSTPLVRGEAPDGEAPDNGPGSTDREVVTPWHQKATKDDGPRPKRKKRPLRSSLLRVHDVPTHTMLPGALATSVPQGEGTPPAPPKAAPPLLPLVIVSVAAGIAIATGVLLVYARRHPPAAHVAVEPSAAPSNAPVASIAPAVSTVALVAPPTPPAEPVEVVPTATTIAAKPPAAATPEPAAATTPPADEAPPPPPRKKRHGPSQAEIDQALRDKQMGIVDPFKPEPKRGGKK